MVKDKEVKAEISLNAQSGIKFAVTKQDGSPTPCKAQFIGIEGTPSPKLGPVDRAHGCVDQYHSENGSFQVGLAPGKYKVVVTRGIEYDHFEKVVEIKEGNLKKSKPL